MTIFPFLWVYHQCCKNPRGHVTEEKPARISYDIEMGLDISQGFTIYYFYFLYLSQEYHSSVRCFLGGQLFFGFDQWQFFFNYI